MARAVRDEQNCSGRLPSHARKSPLGVGHDGFQQVLGPARHFQQFGHGPAAAGEHEDDLARGSVDLADEIIGKDWHGSPFDYFHKQPAGTARSVVRQLL